ncbi:MAG: hypothetical protein K2H10_07085, partial [Bacteroidales bacterium]|nr:hypothetical protein [Bacteroidales bacterium]
MRIKERIIALLIATVSAVPSSGQAQEQSDSLVRLLDARSLRLIQSNGQNLRKVIGPARFFHNNTYLLCDTALWNVDTRVIDAVGNVSIIQDGTVLTSDKMVYYSDMDLAEFRGHVVQLRDSDNNVLRTSNLDYNTKDSVAVFTEGGSMRDKDGQIIESWRGTYDSKIKTFTFTSDVNMFTDSVFVKTSTLKYESDKDKATFGSGTDVWQEDNMLSADAGWYDRRREIFFFRNNVHVMTDTQEGWSDSLYFYRNTSDVEMLGRAQVTDTSRNVSAVAGQIRYSDSLAQVTLTRKPAIISEIEDGGQRDTLYFGADTMLYRTIRYCDIDSIYLVDAAKRLDELSGDPVAAYRRKSAEEAAKAAEEAAKNDPNYRPPQQNKNTPDKGRPSDGGAEPPLADASPKVQDSGAAQAQLPDVSRPPVPELPGRPLSSAPGRNVLDSLAVQDSLGPVDSLAPVDTLAPVDSLAVLDSLSPAHSADSLFTGDTLFAADTVAVEPLDTTKFGFLTALRNVKL